MKLRRLRVRTELGIADLPRGIASWIAHCTEQVTLFWDRFPDKKSPEWTECDFEFVSTTLFECHQRGLLKAGESFVEWGSGFAVIAGIASRIGMRSIGIEVEPFLCRAARELQVTFAESESATRSNRTDIGPAAPTLSHGQTSESRLDQAQNCAKALVDVEHSRRIDADIWEGSFLPLGSARFAEAHEPRVALKHGTADLYTQHGGRLDDFSAVFCYAWPGEEHFLKSVFATYCKPGCLLILHRGPYEIELYRNEGPAA